MPDLTVRTSFKEDMQKLWGNWRVCSEIGELKAVLMRRPGKEVEGIDKPQEVCMNERIDPEKARKEHDVLAGIYRENRVNVYYIEEMDEGCPNGMYCRDQVLGTPEGVIITRPGVKVRSAEVMYAARQVMKIGIPIVKTINGKGIFEGACLTWIDGETAIVGTGTRCNREGYIQVEEELRNMGVKNVIKIDIPRNQNHLDGFLGIADIDIAVTYPYITPNIIYNELEKRGFRIIEVPSFEEKTNFAMNFVTLEPGKVIMPSGNPMTTKLLREAGVEVLEVGLEEIKKGGGAAHCLTAFLHREPIPVYKYK